MKLVGEWRMKPIIEIARKPEKNEALMKLKRWSIEGWMNEGRKKT